MEYKDVRANLEQRAIRFHEILSESSVYQKDLATTQFLSLVEDHISDIAQGISSGRIDPWVNVLAICDGFLFKIKDYVYECGFDTMSRADACYAALEDLLAQAGYSFSWKHNQDDEILEFVVDGESWQVPCKRLEWIEEPVSQAKIEPYLTDFLHEKDWALYPSTTGDSWARYLLVPLRAIAPLRRFLIPAHPFPGIEYDDRAEWLYVGVPEDSRPEDLWDI